MSKLSNELLMIQLLSNGRKYSIKELSNILEVSERMVRCYKEEIEKSGIIIETIRGIYGGYILKNDYLIPKMKFNDYEYKFLSNIKCSNENKKLLDEILIKVKSMSNCNDTKYIVSSEIKNYYNILNKAIREHRKVFVKYESYSEGIGDRIIHPLDIFYYNNGFGCAAFCERKNDLRHFDLSRIKFALLMDEFFR